MGVYPPPLRMVRPLWGMLSVMARVPDVLRSYAYDVTLLQREMLSTFVTLESLTHQPRVLDVDDAIWLHRRGGYTKQLATICDAVICGNSFLADQFGQWNKKITIIPTAVDTDRFRPALSVQKELLIGWIGTSSNFKYLYMIESALREVLDRVPHVRLRIIADKAPVFEQIPLGRAEFLRWAPEIEIKGIQEMAVGIMPIDDSMWARGKCSYKMLLYMACGIPVVVSPVGMNKEILDIDKVGLGAVGEREWVDSLVLLLESESIRREMGQSARCVAVEHFSIQVLAPKLANTLLVAAGRGR
ncbi:MAG: glycosyltransferase family 4 protein [Sulfuricaulis sp.]|uniref:glycosyltransferase family 4 protein n=1 Tax=Sulfuricaulis sp. TaxID=2003553 RepID=UPI0034A37B42